MSMVAVFKLECCDREMVYGRFILPAGAMHLPETTCPLCFKKITLNKGRYAEEHLVGAKYLHKYVLPKEPEVLF